MISGANEEEMELAGARMDIMLATNYTTKNPGSLAIIDKYHDKEIDRLNNIIKCIKEYADWHIDCITSDIKDYIDDDKEGNKLIIGNFKEDREHWRDVSKMCDDDFQLYMTNFEFAKDGWVKDSDKE